VEVVAAKVLIDWLRNRQQLLVPFNLDLRKLAPAEAERVIHAMAAAAQADGTFDDTAKARLEAALEHVHARQDQRTLAAHALEKPAAMRDVLKDVKDAQTGAIFYAASLLAIDRRKNVNRRYLRYLAARLQLSAELSRNLERRFTAVS